MIERIICFFFGHQEGLTFNLTNKMRNKGYFMGRGCLYCHKIQLYRPGDIIDPYDRWDRDL